VHDDAGPDERFRADAAALAALYRSHIGAEPDDVHPLRGDASARRIYRLRRAAATCIGIVNDHRAENAAFLGFSRTFRAAGLPVPDVLAVSDDGSHYLEEDLGDSTFADWIDMRPRADAERSSVLRMYARVLRDLVRFQIDAADDVDYGLCYQTAVFDRGAMLFDLMYFREMFVETCYRGDWDPAGFERDADVFVDRLLEEDPRWFLYRDFQSRNVMIREGAPWFIDYQSGRRGALQYDVASMLYDARGALAQEERAALLDAYLDDVSTRIPLDRGRWLRLFDGFAALRLMQALGAFGKLGLRFGRISYVAHIPARLQVLGAVARRAETLDGLPALQNLLHAISTPDAPLDLTPRTTI
jgi:aminoglycoside/choline kinase family phosphotransferase